MASFNCIYIFYILFYCRSSSKLFFITCTLTVLKPSKKTGKLFCELTYSNEVLTRYNKVASSSSQKKKDIFGYRGLPINHVNCIVNKKKLRNKILC